MNVDQVTLDIEHVARRAGEQDLRPELLAQSRNEVLQRAEGRLRWRIPPKLVHQAIGRDDLAGPERQEREQRALLPRAEVEPTSQDHDLGGAE